MSQLNSERNSDLDDSHRVMIDTTQGADIEAQRAKLLSEGAQRPPQVLSAKAETDEFQMSGKGGPSSQGGVGGIEMARIQAPAFPQKADSFQSESRAPSERSASARHEANASDIIDSDSELEVAVPETNTFAKVAPEKTYKSFAEADAAAESQENAYGSSQDVTRKSAFKGGGVSKPSDNFARVTWTDLAMGQKSAFGGGDQSRAGSRSGHRSAGGGLSIKQEVADFSLANQEQKIGEDYEEMKSFGEDVDEPEQIEDQDAPQQFKANFVRRNTIIRQQILESDDNLKFLDRSKSNQEMEDISERNKSGEGGRSDSDGNRGRSDQETDGILNYDIEDEDTALFGNFKFRSFKTHKLIEEDYELLNIEDPEDVTNISAATAFPEEKVGKEAVEIVPVTKDDLMQHKKEQEKTRAEQQKHDKKIVSNEDTFIKKKQKSTVKDLDKREIELEDLIKRKQERSKKEFQMKQEVLKDSFKASVDSLIKRVRKQKEIITSSYGPIVLNSKRVEKPIFEINPELDPDGHKFMKTMIQIQEKLPQTILVKLRVARCLKDKISSGHYLIICHALDRIGGNRIELNSKRTEEEYRLLSRNLRQFGLKKRQFLNAENRQIVQKDASGQNQYIKAEATGQNFFKADALDDNEAQLSKSQIEQSQMIDYDKPIDMQKDIQIDLDKTATQYTRFNGRFLDENLEVEDVIPVMIPAELESTNCLQFKLVLLQSDLVPRDYVVGWGIFPLNNSDFGLNEGLFKVPLLFGNVDPRIDKFDKIELAMMKDLDSWVANLYFEIEKVNLMDIKEDKKTKKLYYQPVSGMTAQEQQQKNKQEDNDEYEDEKEAAKERKDMLLGGQGAGAGADDHRSNLLVNDEDDPANGAGSARQSARSAADKGLETSSDDEQIDTSDQTSMNASEVAEQWAEEQAELVYNSKRTEEEINYDHYQFSVAQKYDLTTRRMTYKKVKYISDELFLDLKWRMRKTIQFQTSLLFIVFIFFLRQLVHYLGQYVACVVLAVPITKFDLLWYRCDLEFAAWNFQQVAIIVAAGPIANCLLFSLAAASSGLIRMILKSYPKYFYKVIAWTGLFAVLDPFFVLISDLASGNTVNGDMMKFYWWFEKAGDNGIVGAYLSTFIMMMLTIFTGYLWYRFMVGYYMNGRILDLYRRLSGTYKSFFIPMDHEVSLKYLQWVITRAKKANNVIVSEKRKLFDKFGEKQIVNFIQIMKVDKKMLKKSRLFFKDFDGSIIEVPQKKIFVRTKELKELKRLHKDGAASVYGEVGLDGENDIPQLCKNTNHWIRNHRAVGTLKNEEEGIVPYPELQAGGDEIVEEEEPEQNEAQTLLKRGTSIMRQKTVKEVKGGIGNEETHQLLGASRGRNMSMHQAPKKQLGDSPRGTEPEGNFGDLL